MISEPNHSIVGSLGWPGQLRCPGRGATRGGGRLEPAPKSRLTLLRLRRPDNEVVRVTRAIPHPQKSVGASALKGGGNWKKPWRRKSEPPCLLARVDFRSGLPSITP